MNIKNIILIIFVLLGFYAYKSKEYYDKTEHFRDIIVKIYSQNITFDWIEPNKNESSYESIGTGFFISENLILTASHVVEDSIRVDVSIPLIGKKKFKTEIVSLNPYFDFALIKILKYKSKKYLEFGDSKKIKSGDKVLALGYPLAQDKLKLTAGIISGIHKGEIQTDAPINPGNSGGPLLNEENKVIGINVSGYRGADNIGYAVPINRFKLYEKEMKSKKENKIISKPILGGTYINTNQELLNYYNIKDQGILITQSYKGGSLDSAGISQGDIISKFDNYNIDKYGEIDVDWYSEKLTFDEIFDEYKAGDEVKVKFYKKGIEKNIKMKLQPMSFYKIRYTYPTYENVGFVIIGGMIFMDLKIKHLDLLSHNDLNKYYDYKNQTQEKIVLTNIMNGSYINNLDILEEGMTLESINNIKVDNVNKLLKEFKKIKINDDKYVLFSFSDGTLLVIEIQKIIEEDLFLKENHKYNIRY